MWPQRMKKDTPLTEANSKSSEPAGLPSLQLSRNGEVLKKLPLDVRRVLIGRSKDNDVSIPSRFVSWHHILLVRHEGATILIDLNSTNGTFVNAKRVYGPVVLANDDVITVDIHSMFVAYSIKYCDPSKTRHGTLDDIAGADAVIKKALKDIGSLLGKSDTDSLPVLTESVPTEMGFLDDR